MSSQYPPQKHQTQPTDAGADPKALSSDQKRTSAAFDQSLTTREQLIVLTVILTISALLFAVVYGWMKNTRPTETVLMTEAEVSRLTSLIEEASLLPPASSREQTSSPPKTSGQEASSHEPSSDERSSDERSSDERSSNERSSDESSSDESSSDESSSDKKESLPSFLQEHHTEMTDSFGYHSGQMILVNKTHGCVADGTDLCSLLEQSDHHYVAADYTVSLCREAAGHFNNMMNDFYGIYGETDVMVACGFRNYDTQAQLYENEFAAVGEDAAQWVAPPGCSEHQTGYAVDLTLDPSKGDGSGNLNYENVPPYSWINDNCSQYGFVVRYPEEKEALTGFHYESWHFRYVGYPAAYYMTRYGLVLEEFIELLHHHPPEDPLYILTEYGDYALYTIPVSDDDKTALIVPDNCSYTVSGDNDGAFIVTVSF